MNSNKYLILSAIMTGMMIQGCTEIFEADISKEKIILLAPYNSLVSTVNYQVFWWEPVEYADQYQFQIVKPDFQQIERLVADTVIDQTKIEWNLYPGVYQWRVRALNSGYSTDFTTYSLTIDSTYDISDQQVALIKPVDKDTFNYVDVEYQWSEIIYAENYIFWLEKDQQVIIDTTLDNTFINHHLEGEQGAYQWKVRGLNDISATPYSLATFFLDTISPLMPILLIPQNDTVYSDSTISFTWIRDSGGGSRLFDSLYLYYEEMGSLPEKYRCNEPSFTSSLQSGQYYWTVRTFDRAGNKSNFSPIRNFSVSVK